MNAAIVNPKGRYCRVTEACSQTNWSRNTLNENCRRGKCNNQSGGER